MKITTLTAFACFVLCPAWLAAQELEAIPSELASRLATQLVEQAKKIDKPQIKVDGDAKQANGFHVPRKVGLLIVPQADLKESEELDAKFKTDPGASVAILFTLNVIPIVDGKKIDANRLRSVSFSDEQGQEHPLHVFLLAIHQPAPDDYRLHVYGKDAKPIVDAKFAEGTGPGPVPVAVELKDANKDTREGTVVVTVFGKYQASFKAAYSGD